MQQNTCLPFQAVLSLLLLINEPSAAPPKNMKKGSRYYIRFQNTVTAVRYVQYYGSYTSAHRLLCVAINKSSL